jgi:hypothetical protein
MSDSVGTFSDKIWDGVGCDIRRNGGRCVLTCDVSR